MQRLRTTTPDLIVADVNGTTHALLDWLRGAGSALCAAATDPPAGEPTGVLTKVNLEQGRRKARGARDSGARSGVGDPAVRGDAPPIDNRCCVRGRSWRKLSS
jgi:hypothetical protein